VDDEATTEQGIRTIVVVDNGTRQLLVVPNGTVRDCGSNVSKIAGVALGGGGKSVHGSTGVVVTTN
jgi:hypothetical protein